MRLLFLKLNINIQYGKLHVGLIYKCFAIRLNICEFLTISDDLLFVQADKGFPLKKI